MGKISNNIGDKSLAESVQHHLLSYILESGDARKTIVAAYQAVTTGMLIYEADRETRLEYESGLRGLYFDFKPFLEKLRAGTMSGSTHGKAANESH